jgi:hypothetical protein
MNYYCVSWSWYEDFCPHEFSHEEDKTKEEFEADVKSLFVKYG